MPVSVTMDRGSSDLLESYNTNRRPNLMPGVTLTPAGGLSPGHWINPVAFAVPTNGPGTTPAAIWYARRRLGKWI